MIEKVGRNVQPTVIGKELVQKASGIIALESTIEEYIDNAQKGYRGKLRIAATYLPANYLLPTWAAQFKKNYPEVNLEIVTTNSTGAAALVENYQADIALFGGSTENQSIALNWEKLTEDDLWFVVSPNHPLANEEVSLTRLMKEPFVMREEGSSTRERLLALCKNNGIKHPDFGLQFSGLNEVVQSVIQGYGANFVSSLAVKEYVKDNKLARVYVEDIEMKNIIAIGTRKNETPSKLMNSFIESILH